MKSHDLDNPTFLMRRAANKIEKAKGGLATAQVAEAPELDSELEWTIGQLEAAVHLLKKARSNT